ncbi:hypothetical protein CRUP_022245 [Coryphaenoides rupestris]|nr:hypothetical protein CRUP_022245 [Coryphaenoides rupestris]
MRRSASWMLRVRASADGGNPRVPCCRCRCCCCWSAGRLRTLRSSTPWRICARMLLLTSSSSGSGSTRSSALRRRKQPRFSEASTSSSRDGGGGGGGRGGGGGASGGAEAEDGERSAEVEQERDGGGRAERLRGPPRDATGREDALWPRRSRLDFRVTCPGNRYTGPQKKKKKKKKQVGSLGGDAAAARLQLSGLVLQRHQLLVAQGAGWGPAPSATPNSAPNAALLLLLLHAPHGAGQLGGEQQLLAAQHLCLDVVQLQLQRVISLALISCSVSLETAYCSCSMRPAAAAQAALPNFLWLASWAVSSSSSQRSTSAWMSYSCSCSA